MRLWIMASLRGGDGRSTRRRDASVPTPFRGRLVPGPDDRETRDAVVEGRAERAGPGANSPQVRSDLALVVVRVRGPARVVVRLGFGRLDVRNRPSPPRLRLTS